MVICSCKVVTDRTINATVASGATTVDEVGARCGAGTCCGGCRPEIVRFIEAHVHQRHEDAA